MLDLDRTTLAEAAHFGVRARRRRRRLGAARRSPRSPTHFGRHRHRSSTTPASAPGHGRGQRRRRVAPRARRQRGRHRPRQPAPPCRTCAGRRPRRSSTPARSPPPPGCRSARALLRVARARCSRSPCAMAADHVREGIRVNCVNPGTADTPWVGRLLAQAADPEAERAALEARQPHGPAGHRRRGRRRGRLPRLAGAGSMTGIGAAGRRRHGRPEASARAASAPAGAAGSGRLLRGPACA